MTDDIARLAAAILNDGSGDIDAFLANVVARERARGRRLCGLLMTYPEGRDCCGFPMVLVDIATGAPLLAADAAVVQAWIDEAIAARAGTASTAATDGCPP